MQKTLSLCQLPYPYTNEHHKLHLELSYRKHESAIGKLHSIWAKANEQTNKRILWWQKGADVNVMGSFNIIIKSEAPCGWWVTPKAITTPTNRRASIDGISLDGRRFIWANTKWSRDVVAWRSSNFAERALVFLCVCAAFEARRNCPTTRHWCWSNCGGIKVQCNVVQSEQIEGNSVGWSTPCGTYKRQQLPSAARYFRSST